ncbi:hypothetical protein GPECTOR_16g578 [Gonium pectorale]|uniref:Uncharacterized protein n=1 Tax=Gonium pectorale TaxID=33097 RepID=A0A150GKZ4_GONPE|nr:hypothetical protein GPECTOR_16g578 [Gonium pectorale]|eukprot:KXZ50405.1 hypothetical protein GPECTOR_16g578 [Gonium pectorale]
MAVCLNLGVDPDVDLVFVEYNVNDHFHNVVTNNPTVRDMERLVRRILSLPVRFSWRETFQDHHPSQLGHEILSELAIHLFQEAAIDAVLRPVATPAVVATAGNPPTAEYTGQRRLRGPMYPGNYAPTGAVCATGATFKEHVQEVQGWLWVNEGLTEARQKWGYISDVPGSWLLINMSTLLPSPGPGAPVQVLLTYLGSYEHMGMAIVECVWGCACSPVVVDAHLPGERVSQTYMVPINSTQSETCMMGVTVLNDTSSGEHKFKVRAGVHGRGRGRGGGVGGRVGVGVGVGAWAWAWA